MFSQLRSYTVSYLLPRRNDASAVQDAVSGHFRHEGVIVAENEHAVIAQIRSMGGLPLSIKANRPRSRFFMGVSREYKRQFLLAIYFNCSQMSAAKALEAVIESETSDNREMMNGALTIIKRGGGFIESMDAMGIFDESVLAILEAGERMGTLPAALHTAIEHLDNSATIAKIMTGILTVAAFDAFMGVGSLIGNRYGMLPNMEKNLPDNLAPEKLAEITDAIKLAYLVNDVLIWGTFVVLVAALIGVYAYFDQKKKDFRKWVEGMVMRIPALSSTILHGAVANSFKVAASLVSGGVQMQVAMEIAAKSTRVPTVIGFWEEAMTRAESGDAIAATMMQPMLDNSDRLLVSAHTDRHQLAQSFHVIADRRTIMAKKAAKQFALLMFFGMMVYTTLGVCVSLYVLIIQNTSMVSGLTAG